MVENPDPEEEIEDVSGLIDQEISEEDIDKANEKKIEAIGQYAEGNYEKAAELFAEAVKLNPGSYFERPSVLWIFVSVY